MTETRGPQGERKLQRRLKSSQERDTGIKNRRVWRVSIQESIPESQGKSALKEGRVVP